MCAQAVSACAQAWGERALAELDAEDRLAAACEKAPTSDPATATLRAAFQVFHLSPPSLRAAVSALPYVSRQGVLRGRPADIGILDAGALPCRATSRMWM